MTAGQTLPKAAAALGIVIFAILPTAGLPAFCVFTDATLMAIAEARPSDERGLRAIAGVGRSKADKYADAVFGILQAGAAGSVVPAGQELGEHAAEPGGDVQLGEDGDPA